MEADTVSLSPFLFTACQPGSGPASPSPSMYLGGGNGGGGDFGLLELGIDMGIGEGAFASNAGGEV